MQFLSGDEASLLHSILVNHILIANESSRSDMLINCGLQPLLYTLSSLRSSPLLFVNELCARLSYTHITTTPSGQPGLVALLNYIGMPPYDVDFSPQEKIFVEHVKQQCHQWYELQSYKQHPIVQLSARERQSQVHLLPKPVQLPVKIDRKEFITGYGLYPLMSEFANRVNYGKASPFTISGDFIIIRDYIIERMCQELNRRVPGSQTLLDISLDPQDVTEGESVIEKKIVHRNRCNELVDLFKEYSKTNIVFTVWSYAFPPRQLKSVATHFWQEVEKNILPILREQNLYFVLLLAGVGKEEGPDHIDKFTRLQIPPKFEMPDLLPWVRGRLGNMDIEQSDTEYCLERLKDHHGDIVRTYHELEYIVSYLQKRYGAS